MARVPYVEPATAPPAVAEALSSLPDLNVYALLAHAESAFVPMLRLSSALVSDLALDPLLRELSILQVGHLAASYVWDQHVVIALACGVTEAQIAAVDRGDLASFTPEQRAVLEYTADMVGGGEVSDERFAALAEHLGPREVVELSMVVGNYLGLARIMTALRIDPEEPAAVGTVGATT
ncbi:carboxymuconolactone decarboxylase family protein [Umezawaea endophytica]|uniref:Carboxymuconolactone decarboxylase family protein n=1 Tax=Umezawaea endophytica TaxID=1654476 RepID=A0A9X2VTA8_9PSEU|nr:carboxymuconolactone decarboxylase family protein [Umezawaea endophytica]MCS7482541.1 carboxymuconolactone decarboxylase family protein [Umezawaea endophytica]